MYVYIYKCKTQISFYSFYLNNKKPKPVGLFLSSFFLGHCYNFQISIKFLHKSIVKIKFLYTSIAKIKFLHKSIVKIKLLYTSIVKINFLHKSIGKIKFFAQNYCKVKPFFVVLILGSSLDLQYMQINLIPL